MIPIWLHAVAFVSLACGFVAFLVIAADEFREPQAMWIMNCVWPVVALFGSAATLWLYFAYGKRAAHGHHETANDTPLSIAVAKGAAHCGSGCTLADIVAEWTLFAWPGLAAWFGWHTVFSEKIFATWVADYGLALVVGIAFQYFSIKPMRQLTVAQGLVAAAKADVLSLTAWQVGMYGAMAVAHFWLFPDVFGAPLQVDSLEFWFVMQVAMWFGFATAYPVNWWLVETGVKERM